MSGVLERHPDLAVIVPHCGGALPVLADRVNEFMTMFLGSRDADAPDAVEQLRRLHYDLAGPAFPRHVPALLGLADPDRLLFESDYCWTPPPVADAHIAAVDAAGPPVDGATWRSLTRPTRGDCSPGSPREGCRAMRFLVRADVHPDVG